MPRPSLYTVPSDTQPGEQQTSILSELEPNRGMDKLRNRLFLASFVLVSLGLVFYGGKTLLRAKPAAPTMDTVAEPLKVSPPTVTSAAPKEEKVPAVIVADAAALEAPAANEVQTATAAAKNEKAAMESPKPVELEKKEKTAVASQNGTATTSAKAAQAPGNKPGIQEKREKDADVTLIAALLSRTSSSGAPAEVPKETTQHLKSSGKTAVNRGDTKRDIVVRNGNESTASLLKRCAALGFFEGELCRYRICSGRWGSDPACPVAQQASAVNSP
jgi:hypothetical protein